MKNIIVSILLTGVIANASAKESMQAIGQNKISAPSEDNIENQRVFSHLDKGYDISIGTGLDLIERSDERAPAYGVEFFAGKIFNLNKNISTTSALTGSYKKVASDLLYDDIKTIAYDIGVAQRFTYSVGSNQISFRPFFEVGLGLGRERFSRTFEYSNGDSGEYIGRSNYRKYSLSLGAQLAFKNGFTPYIKYIYSSMNGSDSIKATRLRNDKEIAERELSRPDEIRATVTKGLVLGLGYMF